MEEKSKTEAVNREAIDQFLSNREDVLRTIFNTLRDAVFLVTSDRKLVKVNDATTRIFGYSQDELFSLSTEALHIDKAHYKEFGRRINDAFQKNEVAFFEFEAKRKSGEIFPSEHTVTQIKNQDGETLGILSVVRDITERKIAETLLRESIEELDAFVQTVAHDLRTPIVPIMGYAEILREQYKNQLDEQGLSYLSEIENAGTEMLSLMENLLSLAHTGTLKRPVEPVSTDKVVARVIKNFGAKITSTGVVLQVSPLPLVRVPKTYLTQIFDNLISNALRYGGKNGGLVEVGGEQTGKQIRFFVRDHGPGLSEQERKRVFEIFFRGENKGEVKGSGIGLAIVYKIARNCGGRAWVEETPGGGCTFWVEIDDEIQD